MATNSVQMTHPIFYGAKSCSNHDFQHINQYLRPFVLCHLLSKVNYLPKNISIFTIESNDTKFSWKDLTLLAQIPHASQANLLSSNPPPGTEDGQKPVGNL